jgi:hypothetical protein
MARARFIGPAKHLGTATKTLTIGPNHPMPTKQGFVRTANVKEGDELLYDLRTEGAVRAAGEANLEHVPMVEDVFEASGPIAQCRSTPASRANFRGYERASYGEVEAVNAARLLPPVFDSCGVEQLRKQVFPCSGAQLEFIASNSAGESAFKAVNLATSSIVGSRDLALARGMVHAAPFECLGFALASWPDAVLDQEFAQDDALDPEGLGDAVLGFPFEIPPQHLWRASAEDHGLRFIGVAEQPLDQLAADSVPAH